MALADDPLVELGEVVAGAHSTHVQPALNRKQSRYQVLRSMHGRVTYRPFTEIMTDMGPQADQPTKRPANTEVTPKTIEII